MNDMMNPRHLLATRADAMEALEKKYPDEKLFQLIRMIDSILSDEPKAVELGKPALPPEIKVVGMQPKIFISHSYASAEAIDMALTKLFNEEIHEPVEISTIVKELRRIGVSLNPEDDKARASVAAVIRYRKEKYEGVRKSARDVNKWHLRRSAPNPQELFKETM